MTSTRTTLVNYLNSQQSDDNEVTFSITPARERDAANIIPPNVARTLNHVASDPLLSDLSSPQLGFDETVCQDSSRNESLPPPQGGLFSDSDPTTSPEAPRQRPYQQSAIALSSQPTVESRAISIYVDHDQTQHLASSDNHLKISHQAQASSLSDASSSQDQLENEQDLSPEPESSKVRNHPRILTPPIHDEWNQPLAQRASPDHPLAPLLPVAQASQGLLSSTLPSPPRLAAVTGRDFAIRDPREFHSSQNNQEMPSDSISILSESRELKFRDRPLTPRLPDEDSSDSVTTSEESSQKPEISLIRSKPNLQRVPQAHYQPSLPRSHSSSAASGSDRHLSNRGLSAPHPLALSVDDRRYDSKFEDSLDGSNTPRRFEASSLLCSDPTHINTDTKDMPEADKTALSTSISETRESKSSPVSQSSSLEATHLPPVNPSLVRSPQSLDGQYGDGTLPPPPPIPDEFRKGPSQITEQNYSPTKERSIFQPTPRSSYQNSLSGEPIAPSQNVVPRSVLKKGGKLFKRARSTVPARVEVTAEDLMPRTIKKVTFSKPSYPTDPNLDIRHERKYRRYLENAVNARKELAASRNWVEIERRNFVAYREGLTKILKMMLGRNSEDADGEPEENSVKFDSEKAVLDNFAAFKQQAILIVDSQPEQERLSKNLKLLEQNLAELEDTLKKKEVLALRKSLGITDPEPRADAVTEDDASNDTPSARSADSEETTATVREYYDMIGEMNLTRDYIHNVDTDFVQLARARQNKRAAGEQQDIPDEEFRREYYHERHQLYMYYQTTKSDINRLYQKSIDKNYGIEPPNLLPEDPDEHPKIDPQLFLNAWSRFHMREPSDNESNTMTSIIRPNVQASIIRSQTLIRTWTRDVGKSRSQNVEESSLVPYSPVWSESDGLNEEDNLDQDKSDEDIVETRFGIDCSKLQRRYSDPDIRDGFNIRSGRRVEKQEQLREQEQDQRRKKRSFSATRLDARYSQSLLY